MLNVLPACPCVELHPHTQARQILHSSVYLPHVGRECIPTLRDEPNTRWVAPALVQSGDDGLGASRSGRTSAGGNARGGLCQGHSTDLRSALREVSWGGQTKGRLSPRRQSNRA